MWSLNKLGEQSLLLGSHNSLLDFDLLELVVIEAVGESLGEVGLFGFEGVEVLALSDLELGDSLVLLDEDGWVMRDVLFLAAFLVSLAALLPLAISRNCLNSVISFG